MTADGADPWQTQDNQYRETFNATIGETIGQAVRIIAGRTRPSSSPARSSCTTSGRRQRCGSSTRGEGLLVPPVMIVSITSRCNLACAGCYMHGRGEKPHGGDEPGSPCIGCQPGRGARRLCHRHRGRGAACPAGRDLRACKSPSPDPLPGLHQRPPDR